MARIHSHRRGKSQSTRPSSKRSPTWVNYSQDEIVATIAKLSKEGLTPSQVGLRLRDEYGIPNAKTFLGKTITEVLGEGRGELIVPEDLSRLVERAAKLKLHLSNHHGDRKNVRSLELLEAKIHRLSYYYKGVNKLPADWKYAVAVAQLA
ncbi:MAG: 30S ribosomal protein S15 [Nitrososphaerota archaeon]|nr:30S ribosomal protein S15 [Nitrososphaerota archaeon]